MRAFYEGIFVFINIGADNSDTFEKKKLESEYRNTVRSNMSDYIVYNHKQSIKNKSKEVESKQFDKEHFLF